MEGREIRDGKNLKVNLTTLTIMQSENLVSSCLLLSISPAELGGIAHSPLKVVHPGVRNPTNMKT